MAMFAGFFALSFAVWLVLSATTTTVYVVRHAESVVDGSPDPVLSPAGSARAQRLALVFGAGRPDVGLDGIVVTERRSSQQTAQPLVDALGIPTVTVPAGEPVAAARRALKDFRGRRVLVIVDGDSLPAVVGKLSGESVAAPNEQDHGVAYVVAVPRYSRASVSRLSLP